MGRQAPTFPRAPQGEAVVAPKAEVWDAVVSEIERQARLTVGAGLLMSDGPGGPSISARPVPDVRPLVQNNLTDAYPDPLPAYSVLAFDSTAPLNPPTDLAGPGNTPAFQQRMALTGNSGVPPSCVGNFCITLAAIARGGVGPCVISGVVACMVVVPDAVMALATTPNGFVWDLNFRADCAGDVLFLVAGQGSARIVWIDASPADPQPSGVTGYPNAKAYWAYVRLGGQDDSIRVAQAADGVPISGTYPPGGKWGVPYAQVSPITSIRALSDGNGPFVACPTFYAVLFGPTGYGPYANRTVTLVRPLGGTGEVDANGCPVLWMEASAMSSVSVQVGNPGFDGDTTSGEYTGILLAPIASGFPPTGPPSGGMAASQTPVLVDNMTEKGWLCPAGNVHLLPALTCWEGTIVGCDNSSPPVARVMINAPVTLDVVLVSDGGDGTSAPWTYTVQHRATVRQLATTHSPDWQQPPLPSTAATHGQVSFDTGFLLGPTDSQYNPS